MDHTNDLVYTRLSLFLKGSFDANISQSHCIRNPAFTSDGHHLNRFDVVVSQPPFLDSNWGYDEAQEDNYNRFQYGFPPKKVGDYGYISHMLASLKATGVMIVVLPQGALYRGAREAEIRENIIKDNLLDAVIVLPGKLLSNTNVPVAILVFNKGKKENDILFIDASQDFESGKTTNKLLPEHVSKITQTYKQRETVDKYSSLVSTQEIENNNFNCNIPRYVDSLEVKNPEEFNVLKSERQRLLKTLDVTVNDIKKYSTALDLH